MVLKNIGANREIGKLAVCGSVKGISFSVGSSRLTHANKPPLFVGQQHENQKLDQAPVHVCEEVPRSAA